VSSGHPPPPEPLDVPVADSHCHLDIGMEGRDGEDGLPVEDALARGAAVGVPRIVQIGCDLAGARWAVEAANRYDEIVAGVSLHPNEAPRLVRDGDETALDDALAEIDRLAADPRVRAVGETGLDYFRTGEEGRALQHRSFRAHIEMAKRHGKALVIHDRDAHDDVLRVLAEEGSPERVVLHCFSGDVAMARECVQRGYWLSFAGTVTFKNADRAAARRDGRPLPHAHPLPRPAERVVPHPAHAPRDGGGQAGAGRPAGERGRRQHRPRVRPLVTHRC
jgi:TatD DNase family protein